MSDIKIIAATAAGATPPRITAGFRQDALMSDLLTSAAHHLTGRFCMVVVDKPRRRSEQGAAL
jgi:hypothetical protein